MTSPSSIKLPVYIGIVYIDDILIYSNTREEHIHHVRSVLKRLMQYQLYAKAEKCKFHQTSFSFLGYIISQEGVAMDERKVKAVLEWLKPQTVKELQRFLGFANFYRRFIRYFSKIAALLTAMTKRHSAQLSGSPESHQAIEELKTRFTSAPIRPRINCGSRCFKYRGRRNSVPTSRLTSQNVPMSIFLLQTHSHRTELRRRQSGASCHEISAWRMVNWRIEEIPPLAGGSYSPIHCSHWSQ